MRGAEIRDTFLKFFQGREHRVVPSSPLVPVGDESLLFTNAGMNQFKALFQGHEKRDYRRAVSVQKCLRVSGKHNDLEQVGRTARHHTFFEMLGNFSFGDYFKEEAIAMAWDLVTQVYGIDAQRLTATVFAGEGSLPADEEAAEYWRTIASLPPARIIRLGARENFWRMGESGPCGPCSELHYDQGEEQGCGRADCAGPACECDRFLEIWNLVFMQFDQQQGGDLGSLPAPSIDTGMGLERMAAILQGKKSNYETDLFVPIMEAVRGGSSVSFEDSGSGSTVSAQVVADHLRAIVFLLAEGVMPSNEGRGYVLRRILRRGFRHGRMLGWKGPFLYELTGLVVDLMGGAYPELASSRKVIRNICRTEEERFEETLDESVKLLERSFAQHAGIRHIPGEELFRLYDTFGLPLDLASELARERGYQLDQEGFHAALKAQRLRARRSWKGRQPAGGEQVYLELANRGLRSRFLGYQAAQSEGEILALVKEGTEVEALGPGMQGQIVLDQTPLYAEAGGQVGEQGRLLWEGGHGEVLDTRSPAQGLIVHQVLVAEGTLNRGVKVKVLSLPEERAATRRNHTGTHLLHAALRTVLGLHVKQAGSLVAPDRLRFDFTHHKALSAARIDEIEDIVNSRILRNEPVLTRIMPRQEALDSGAMALFGEKYSVQVRVVSIRDFSKELCGGLHCSSTGEIGMLKITGEKGISSGVRRIEAVTGTGALAYFRDGARLIREMIETVGSPREGLLGGIKKLMADHRELRRRLQRLQLKLESGVSRSGQTADEIVQVAGVSLLARRVEDLDRGQMRQLSDTLKASADIVVLGGMRQGRTVLLVSVRDTVAERIPASRIIHDLAEISGARGGGKATLAEAGGRDPARLEEAMKRAVEVVARLAEPEERR
ncbi:MAG: alanine--tRNA ligase [Acidobacteriota bacterium]